MSALGQKRTLKRLRPMSALPPIADFLRARGSGPLDQTRAVNVVSAQNLTQINVAPASNCFPVIATVLCNEGRSSHALVS